MQKSVPTRSECPQLPFGTVKQEDSGSEMLVAASAADAEMDLPSLLSDSDEQPMTGTGQPSAASNEPQRSSFDTAQGGSTNPAGIKSLQGHSGSMPYISRRSNESMDIYMLQRQGFTADDDAQYRQFMYKQWKNKQKNIIAELNERSPSGNPSVYDVDKEMTAPTPPTRPSGPPPAPVLLKHDTNSNERVENEAFQLNTFTVLGQTLFNENPHLNYDDFLARGGKICENEIRTNRPETDNRTGATFVWRYARQNEANAGVHDVHPTLRDVCDDVAPSTSGLGGARARNKTPRKKTDERPGKASKTGAKTQKVTPQRHSSAVPENMTMSDITTTPDMTSSILTDSGRKKRGGGCKTKTSKTNKRTSEDGHRKEKRVDRKQGEPLDGDPTTRVDVSSISTVLLDASTASHHNEGTTETGDATYTGTTVTFDLSDIPSCISSVSMTSSMASDIINREMRGLELLSGSSSAESTLSDVLLGLDVRAVIANANKFGRQHLTNGDLDKWLEVGTKLALLQSDVRAPDAATTTTTWTPTTIQSTSASVLLPGRTRFPGNRAKRACATVDDLYAKKRSRGTSTTGDVSSLPYNQDYSDWSTSRLLATSNLISQSDTSVGSSVWSHT